MKTKEYAAKEALEQYAQENGYLFVCDLFSKEMLIEFSHDADWEFCVGEELKLGRSREEAEDIVMAYYKSMTNFEIWKDHISDYYKGFLIVEKAEDLGLEFDYDDNEMERE